MELGGQLVHVFGPRQLLAQLISAPDCTRGGRRDQTFGTSGPCRAEKPGIFTLGGAAIGHDVPDTYPSESAISSCKSRS